MDSPQLKLVSVLEREIDLLMDVRIRWQGPTRPPVPSATECKHSCWPSQSPLVRKKSGHLPDGRMPNALSQRREFDQLCGQLCEGMSHRAAVARFVARVVPSDTEGVAYFMARAVKEMALMSAEPVAALPVWQPAWSSQPLFNLSEALDSPCGFDWHSGASSGLPHCNITSPGRGAGRECTAVRASTEAWHNDARYVYPATARREGKYCLGQCRRSDWAHAMAPELLPACMLGALFQPAPSLTPRFNRLMRTLADESVLAIGIYLRSDHAEVAHRRDSQSTSAFAGPKAGWPPAARYSVAAATLCALQLERRWGEGFERVVWLVVADDPAVNEEFTRQYDQTSGAGVSAATTTGVGPSGRRRVLRTGSSGRHSKPDAASQHSSLDAYGDSLRDALADWFLLSEVDIGVLAPALRNIPYTFGRTAFARGARTRSVYAPPSMDAALASFAAANDSDGAPPVLVRCGADDAFAPMWGGHVVTRSGGKVEL